MSQITLKPLNVKTLEFSIKGVSPIIFHKWGEKAKKMMREKHAGKKTKTREVRDPEAEAVSSMHVTEDGIPAIPAIAFKACLINAAHKDLGIEKTQVRKSLFVMGELIPMTEYSEPWTREDTVTVGMKSTDLRYRKQIDDWCAKFDMEYDADLLQPDDIINLVNRAGFGVGLLEQRPEKGGDNGRFVFDEDQQVVAN